MRVVVVGGGVGSLELSLALHDLAEERVRLTLIAPEAEFRYRPTSVAVPFGKGEVHGFPLAELAGAVGARLLSGKVSVAIPDEHMVQTEQGERIGYDALVVACGARRLPGLGGAVTFGGEPDIPAMQTVIEDIDAGRVGSVVFALPRGASWSLPLYELALLTAAHVRRQNLSVALTLVTPEEQPLAQFGGEASRSVAELLAAAGVTLLTATYPVGVYGDVVMLMPEQTLPADRVVCMPEARGVTITGLPHDFDGFLRTDLYGRVAGVADVYAIGDVTQHPIKQGGLAAQQADVVASWLAKAAGAPIDDADPYRPVLRGLLLTGDEPRFLSSHAAGGQGQTAMASADPLWWPSGKIATRHLGAYLAEMERERVPRIALACETCGWSTVGTDRETKIEAEEHRQETGHEGFSRRLPPDDRGPCAKPSVE